MLGGASMFTQGLPQQGQPNQKQPSLAEDLETLVNALDRVLTNVEDAADRLHGPADKVVQPPTSPIPPDQPSVRHLLDAAHSVLGRIEFGLSRLQRQL